MSQIAPPSKYGKNHKGEKILKVYSKNCPFCDKYMRYFEFQFDVDTPDEGDKHIKNLAILQHFEDLLENTKQGKILRFLGVLIGCEVHYMNKSKKDHDKLMKKPYITLEAEDVWKMSQIPVSHIYLAEKY